MAQLKPVAQKRMASVSQGADVFVESLNANDVKYLFINSGTDTFPIQESMAMCMSQGHPSPQAILCLDEEVAMSAAHGYYMVSGKPQVLLVHVDAGTMQVGGALHNAQRGHAGMVFCAGRAPYTFEGELVGGRNMAIHWLQEQIDQGAGVRMFTKWDYEIRRPETIQQVMQRAFQIAGSEPAGPVYVSIPREVLMAPLETAQIPASSRYPSVSPSYPNPEALAEAANILSQAARPMIIASHAGRHPQTMSHLVDLAELLGAPVVSAIATMNFPTSHPLFAGRAAGNYLEEADALLLVDADVPWIPTLQSPHPDSHIISIDQDPLKSSMPMHFFPADLIIGASSAEAVPALAFEIRQRMGAEASRASSQRRTSLEQTSRLRRTQLDKAATDASSKTPIEPNWLAYCLGQVLGQTDIVLDETVTNGDHVASHVLRSQPKTLFGSGGSSLGWALGASLGAKLAAPDQRVITLVGDGAFVYGCPTATYWAADKYNIPFLTVIFNNQTHYATKRALQTAYPDGASNNTQNFLGLEISPSPEYALIAQSCRAYGETVVHPQEVQPALHRGLERVDAGQAAVIDVRLRRP